jgi:hypothetical protein
MNMEVVLKNTQTLTFALCEEAPAAVSAARGTYLLLLLMLLAIRLLLLLLLVQSPGCWMGPTALSAYTCANSSSHLTPWHPCRESCHPHPLLLLLLLVRASPPQSVR